MSQLPDHLDHVLNDLAAGGLVAPRSGEVREGAVVQMFTFKDFTTGRELAWNADLANRLVDAMDPAARAAATVHTSLADWYDVVVRAGKHELDTDYVASMRRKDLDRPALAIRVTAEMIPGTAPGLIGSAVVIDGNHRMARAHAWAWPTYPVVVLPPEIERQCRVDRSTLAAGLLARLAPGQQNNHQTPAP